MIILGIHTNHDASAALFDNYRMVSAVALERLTRIKSDGYRFPTEAVEECLGIAGLRRQDVDVIALPRAEYEPKYFKRLAWWARQKPDGQGHIHLFRQMTLRLGASPDSILDVPLWLDDHGFKPTSRVHFYNHHDAHALGALFHTDWSDALVYTADGYGDRVNASARLLKDGRLTALWGDDRDGLKLFGYEGARSSIGQLYLEVTQALGFKPLRHEGKVLGLAAWGKPVFAPELRANYTVDALGRIHGRMRLKELRRRIHEMVKVAPREDVAASVQTVLEEVVLEAVGTILKRHPAKALGLAGGVFANVKLNQRLAERYPFQELFIYPAMSDAGIAAGGVLEFLLQRDGLPRWLGHRYRFDTLYFGRDFDAEAEDAFRAAGAYAEYTGNPAEEAARRIAEGAIVGTFLGAMEYGPRALGARSIMARAIDRSINDTLNERLNRTEFMPFAPVVRVERYAEVFELPDSLVYPANFMTTTCDVKPDWRDKVPAITHVDGTARPQLISRDQNRVYWDILDEYEKLTSLPVLINTSFNVHEEPIINTPSECVRALKDRRVDLVVTKNAIWSFAG
ncbi:MAG: hypothetical protein HC909_03385 [Blastochloris sp.]|nr:hypothetical protein [Blastochloris sp.]